MTPYHLGWLGCIRYSDPSKPDEMAGANMAFHRKVLEKVPKFDVELGGGALGNCEDTLFSRQVREAGYPLYAAYADVEHHFDPAKLLYAQWIKNANASGRSLAYLMYHWLHQDISNPFLKYCYFVAKLQVRLRSSPKIFPAGEGIPSWELSYRVDIAKCAQFILERRRPRNYTLKGLNRLSGER